MRQHSVPARLPGAVVLAALLASISPAAASSGPALEATPDWPAIVKDLETLATSEMVKQSVPGLSFAIVQGDTLIHAKGYGVKKVGTAAAVTEHTVFEAASVTKSFTSVLVGMAVDEGKLKWDDRVVEILPHFRMYDPWVTKEFRVDDLMAQRSGMPTYSLDEMGLFGWERWDLARAVDLVEPTYSFRAQYSYVNTLWTWAAGLVEKRWGLSWENAMARRILGPLGMTESTVDPEVLPYLDDVATGHIVVAPAPPWPVPADWPYRDAVDVGGPSASLRTTVLDLAKWARFHLAGGTFEGQRLLSAETVSRLHAARSSVMSVGPRNLSYAQGWIYDSRSQGPVIWHNGSSLSMHSIVALYPSANVGLLVMTNEADNTIPEGLDARLYSLLFPAAAPPTGAAPTTAAALSRPPAPVRVRPDGVVPLLPLARYAGSYSNPAFGTITVGEQKGALVVTIGPRKVGLPATHFSGNVFTLLLPDYPGWETKATFDVPAGGAASRLQIEKLTYVKEGWFERTGP